jgi:hypothetical protein
MTHSVAISCHGKECYPTKGAAIKAKADRIGRAKSWMNSHKEKKRDVTRLQTYRCSICHHWHLGHGNDGKAYR